MSSAACEFASARLPLFAGGDLDVGEAEVVRAHLIDCVACRNEAAGLQRAVAGLRAVSASPAPGVDDAWFAAQQRAICERVEAAAVPAASSVAWRSWGLAAAALLLIGIGFELGQSGQAQSVFVRPATTILFGNPKAVPWSGERAMMRQLGDDEQAADERDGAAAAGMRGRDELRTLVDDGMVLPPKKRVLR